MNKREAVAALEAIRDLVRPKVVRFFGDSDRTPSFLEIYDLACRGLGQQPLPLPADPIDSSPPSREIPRRVVWNWKTTELVEICESCAVKLDLKATFSEQMASSDVGLIHLLNNQRNWSGDVALYLSAFQEHGKQSADLLAEINRWEVRCLCAECEAQRSQAGEPTA